MRQWQKNNPLKVQLWDRRRCARERGLEFTITLDDLESVFPSDGRCPVCAVVVERGSAERQTSPSIDRIDNDRGYVPGNVHVVCLGCNGKKSDLTIKQLAAGHAGSEWRAWARRRLGRSERHVVRAALSS